MDQIAVFSRDRELVPFAECNMAAIYKRIEEGWEIIRTDSFFPLTGKTIKERRGEADKISDLIKEVTAIACKEITGIPFSVFDRKGYCIFSIEDISNETLNGIITDIEESDEKKRLMEEMLKGACPVETQTPGVYMLNLKELQKEYPDISSKKALKPFLSDTPFLELHLICEHVPPWLERDAAYEKKIQEKEAGRYILVTKKQG